MASRFRSNAFRTVAGILAVGMLLFAGQLAYWGATAEFPWARVLPTLVGQLLAGSVFGIYALGKGPFKQSGPHA